MRNTRTRCWRRTKSWRRTGSSADEAAPTQVKHDKAKALGYRWENMGKKPKEEEATLATLQEHLKTHGEAIKERTAKMAPKHIELDAAVADLSEARQREQGDEDDPEAGPPETGTQRQAGPAHMAQPVPGPTAGEAQKAASQRSEAGTITKHRQHRIGHKGGPALKKQRVDAAKAQDHQMDTDKDVSAWARSHS